MPDEIIDADAEEITEGLPEGGSSNLPAVAAVGASATLFHTNDPTEIVQRAVEVANALARVLRERNLTTTISGREHVRVEGWTFCGTMLGVFPVVTWTREIENGWEARVEARTLSGAIVGAAEAECLRSESKWKSRDDYALRSMAQTRAVSKALRNPLGFIVSLAGFDPTPEEEMPSGGEHTPQRPVDPGVQLPSGFPAGEDLGQRVGEALRRIDPSVDWRETWEAANLALYGARRSSLDPKQKAESLYRLANVAERLTGDGDFPPPSDAEITAAIAFAFKGEVVTPTRTETAEPGDAPLGSGPVPDYDDSIQFGDSDNASEGS